MTAYSPYPRVQNSMICLLKIDKLATSFGFALIGPSPTCFPAAPAPQRPASATNLCHPTNPLKDPQRRPLGEQWTCNPHRGERPSQLRLSRPTPALPLDHSATTRASPRHLRHPHPPASCPSVLIPYLSFPFPEHDIGDGTRAMEILQIIRMLAWLRWRGMN